VYVHARRPGRGQLGNTSTSINARIAFFIMQLQCTLKTSRYKRKSLWKPFILNSKSGAKANDKFVLLRTKLEIGLSIISRDVAEEVKTTH